jgi:hypothetical protein
MHGDFSRQTFDRRKRYAGVLLQQGRVQTDADWNEATLIQRYHAETTATDTIGATGAPRDQAGFLVTIVGGNLTIGMGRHYVDGILCENDAPLALSAQAGITMPGQAGLYAAFLDAWTRHISAIEDPDIREPALGGPDTAARIQTSWLVRLVRVGNVNAAASCNTVRPLWQAALARTPGTLRAGTQTVTPPTTPCVLPASADYRGLENQLYRVEIHEPGNQSNARFKWSRENGSVVAAVENVSGVDVTVRDLRADDPLGFSTGDWVELIDDVMELREQRGQLRQIAELFTETRIVRLNAAPSTALDPTRHPRLRRWDQATGANAQGVPVATSPTALERGIEVTFGTGQFEPGDFWLIPARTAIGNEQGTIQWPAGQFRLPEGIRHHYALLGAFNFDGNVWSATAAPDCREIFPPLTDIHALDVVYDAGQCADLAGARTVQQALDILCERREECCGFVIEPAPGWEAIFDQIPPGGNAHLCFRAADYPLAATRTIANKGTLVISGAGAASRILAPNSECALLFSNCTDVTLHDLNVITGVSGVTTPNVPALNGALTFDNVPSVTIEHVGAHCRAAATRRAACITVRNAEAAAPGVNGPGRARIRACDLDVGYLQIGMLLVNVARATIEDNFVRVGAEIPASAQIGQRITDLGLRANVRRLLMFNTTVMVGPAPVLPPVVTTAPGGVITVRAGVVTVVFHTDPTVANAWPAMVGAQPPTDTSTAGAVIAYLSALADRILYDPAFRSGFAAMNTWYAALRADHPPSAAQGIVVGGRVANELRIRGNTLSGMIEGIHIGVSHRESVPGIPDAAGTLLIADNTVENVLPAATTRHRYGIYVGNHDSAVIENNFLTVRRTALTQRMHIDGIHIFGRFGRRAIVRQNHLRGFQTGVLINPLAGSPVARRLWMVTETVAEGAALAVSAPAGVVLANNVN